MQAWRDEKFLENVCPKILDEGPVRRSRRIWEDNVEGTLKRPRVNVWIGFKWLKVSGDSLFRTWEWAFEFDTHRLIS